MDSFATFVTSNPTPATPEIPVDFEDGGGPTGYCVVSQAEDDNEVPMDFEDGGGPTGYCVIA
jgi:hypothetical protein